MNKRNTLALPKIWEETKMLKHGDTVMRFFETCGSFATQRMIWRMNEPHLRFEEKGQRTCSIYQFYDDHIERNWRMLFRSGMESYPTANISAQIAEQTTFAYGLTGDVRRIVIFLIIGLVLHLGFSHPVLNRIGSFHYVLAAFAALASIPKLRKDHWLYVKNVDGSTLFSVREGGLKGITRDEFVREIQRYAKKS